MREHIKELEKIISTNFRPTFLSIQVNEYDRSPFIHVVVSSTQFSNLSVEKRVALVFKAIVDNKEDIINIAPIVVETFSSSEMVEIFEYIK